MFLLRFVRVCVYFDNWTANPTRTFCGSAHWNNRFAKKFRERAQISFACLEPSQQSHQRFSNNGTGAEASQQVPKPEEFHPGGRFRGRGIFLNVTGIARQGSLNPAIFFFRNAWCETEGNGSLSRCRHCKNYLAILIQPVKMFWQISTRSKSHVHIHQNCWLR